MPTMELSGLETALDYIHLDLQSNQGLILASSSAEDY